MSEKKVIFYTDVAEIITVGERTVVWPVNHTIYDVINGQVALTTVVESYDKESGVFETKNAIYKPNILLG